MGTKICKTCKVEKQLTEFYPDKTGKQGVKAVCKVCRNIYMKNYMRSKKPQDLSKCIDCNEMLHVSNFNTTPTGKTQKICLKCLEQREIDANNARIPSGTNFICTSPLEEKRRKQDLPKDTVYNHLSLPVIEKHIKKTLHKYGKSIIASAGFEDLVQYMHMQLLALNYDPKKSGPSTFIYLVVQSRCGSLYKKHRSNDVISFDSIDSEIIKDANHNSSKAWFNKI